MNMNWKMISLLLLIVTLLSACGGNDEGSQHVADGDVASENNSVVEEVVENKEPAEVIFYARNGLTEADFFRDMGNAVQKKFPHMTIRFFGRVDQSNDLPEVIATQQRFDIYIDTIGNFENNVYPLEFQYDMTELIKKHNVDLSKIDPIIMDGIKKSSGGKIFAVPLETSALVLFYNIALFEKFGISYPSDGITWDEVFDLNRQLTRSDNGTQFVGFEHYPIYTMFMDPLSIPKVDQTTETPTINKDARWEMLFKTLFVTPSEATGYQDYILSAKGNVFDRFIADQTSGMLLSTAIIMVSRLEGMQAMDFDVVSMPSFSSQPGVGSQPYSMYYGITNMAEDKDAAMKVLEYMLSDEFQGMRARQGVMTVLHSDDVRKLLGQEAVLRDKNWPAAYYNKFAEVPYKGPYEVQVASIYANYAFQVMQGKIDLNTALRQAEEEATKKVEEFIK